MHYIVFDLEFNQDFSSFQGITNPRYRSQFPFEIIQMGAIKLDSNFKTVDTFNHLVRPTVYSKVSPFITELTGIKTEQLLTEKLFKNIYEDFINFVDDPEAIYCIWGMADIRELYRNAEYHNLDRSLLSKIFIDIQPYVSRYFNLPPKKLFRLQSAAEALKIPITYKFHHALNDAYYTAEIFKKIYNTTIEPRFYDPTYIKIKQRQRSKKIDYEKLILQFEKMYDRNMTQEEQEIIKLAYKMGKTKQFLK